MDLYLSSNFIPAWFVALNMIFAGIMLRTAFRLRLRARTALYLSGTTLTMESLVYAVVFQIFNIDAETRGFIVRLMIIAICMSLYLPLFVSYLRSRNRDT